VICALSWTIHYCETDLDLGRIVARCRRALRARGVLIVQVANVECMTGAVNIEHLGVSSGQPDDTFFIHRFRPLHDAQHRVIAHYVYASHPHQELLSEEHELRFANPLVIGDALRSAGFQEVVVINSESIAPFVIGGTV
jgi:hypothetical protein